MTLQIVNKDVLASQADMLISLFEIDSSAPEIGGTVMRFCNEVDSGGASVVWKSLSYSPYPIQMSEVETEGKGLSNRPKLALGNVNGFFSAVNVTTQDMLGAKVTRRRVLTKYLDGHGSANTSAGLPEDIFFIDQKVSENRQQVVYELCSVYDLDGIMLPTVRVNSSACAVRYRGPECGYTGTVNLSDKLGNPITGLRDRGMYAPAASDYLIGDVVYQLFGTVRVYYICKVNSTVGTINQPAYWTMDVCNKRLISGCKLRFSPGSANNPMPFLAFPGTTKLPQ